MEYLLVASIVLLTVCGACFAQGCWSGIYPHLAHFNKEGECGTGAVVVWADRLWVITYAPHEPYGSSDKLYEITPDLERTTRPESIGGTPANRMIHRESNQLFIGPYVIDAQRKVRVIPYDRMPGRHTGNARHLTDPAGKIYCATMEEGFYEIDVRTLEVTTLYRDTHEDNGADKANLPGNHGKGLYSGQGVLVYSNNGGHSRREAFARAGSLSQWDGEKWQNVINKQFTEVTGPGGIYGNENPRTDPLWSVGWDEKSLILMTLHEGRWHRYRLAKASHTYDGAHGWHTEWPRIRDIGRGDLLMTMHGMFWRFPRDFRPGNTGGIRPCSTYLKIIGDFCRWEDRVVFGCDDAAKKEFLNYGKGKGNTTPEQSQSNLWFVQPEQIDHFGPALGRGAVWLGEDVESDEVSDPFLVAGFDRRVLHLAADSPGNVTVEVDPDGSGQWRKLDTIRLDTYHCYRLDSNLEAQWMRLRSQTPLKNATAVFHMTDRDPRDTQPDKLFQGLSGRNASSIVAGLMRASTQEKGLEIAALSESGPIGTYVLDPQMQLRPSENTGSWKKLHDSLVPEKPEGLLKEDEASVICIDEKGRRWRLPRREEALEPVLTGRNRLNREIVTERDLFNCQGTFYELPAISSGGFQRMRPIASHNLQINDFCSYRGLLVLSGIDMSRIEGNRHIIRSSDGKMALWVGALDDLWKLGKPVGVGGPWMSTQVQAGQVSDPYIFNGFDRKTLRLRAGGNATVGMELDISGQGHWQTYRRFQLQAGEEVVHKLPEALEAYWVRFVSDTSTRITAQLIYE